MALEGFNLGTAYAEVVLSADGVKSGVAQAKSFISEGMASIGDSFKAVGGQLTSIGGGLTALGAPFLAFAGIAVKSAIDSRKELAQLDAVLKSTGGSAGVTGQAAIDLATSLQSVTNFSDETVLSTENMLLTFTNVGEKVFPYATAAALNMSQALGQDTKNSAIQLGKALNDPIRGITALSRVGVTFTESQKEMIKSMMDMGDVAGAQKVILDELNKEFGGSAEAAVAADGGITQLTNKFDDMMETVGNALIPVVKDLVTWLSSLVDWFNNLDPGVKQTIITIGLLLAGLAVIGPVIAAIGLAISSIGAIIEGLGALLAGPLVPIALLIGAIVLLAQHFGVTFEQIQVWLSLIALYAQYYFQQIITALQPVIDKFINFPQTLSDAATAAQNLVDLGLLVLTTALNSAATAAQSLIDIVKLWITQNATVLQTLLDGTAAFIAAKIALAAYNVVMAAAAAGSGIVTLATQAMGAAVALATSPIVVLTAAIWSLVEAYRALQQFQATVGAAQANTAAQLGGGIRSGAITKEEYEAQAFKSGVAQFGDLAMRLIWGDENSDIRRMLMAPYYASLQSRDSGGYGSAGQAYMIGTGAQPEMFVPNTAGTFVPNAGGGDININGDINISANSYAEGKNAMNGALDAVQERKRSRGG